MKLSKKEKEVIEMLKTLGYKTEEISVDKNGKTVEGICISKGKMGGVYYEGCIAEMLEYTSGNIPATVKAIESGINAQDDIEKKFHEITSSIDKIKEHLFIGVKRHGEKDNTIIRETFMEGVDEYMFVDMPESSIKVNKDFLETIMKMSADEAFKIAEQNTYEGYEITDITKLLKDTMGAIPGTKHLYSLTSRIGFRGAGCVVLNRIIKNFCTKHKCEGVYMLPSSVHEVILIPCKEYDEELLAGYSAMVKSINQTMDDDVTLSDKAYYIPANRN